MSRFSHLIEDYLENRPNSKNRSNQKNHSNLDNVIFDRDQIARSSHAEHANESSKSSHHSRRLFVEISNFFVSQYVVSNAQQRLRSIVDVIFSQFARSVFDQPISLNSHSNL